VLKRCTFSHKKKTIGILGLGLVPFHLHHNATGLLCLLDICIPLVADCPTGCFFLAQRRLKQERRCSAVQHLGSPCLFSTEVLHCSLTPSWHTGKWISLKKNENYSFCIWRSNISPTKITEKKPNFWKSPVSCWVGGVCVYHSCSCHQEHDEKTSLKRGFVLTSDLKKAMD